MLSIAYPRIGGLDVTIFTGSLKPSSRRLAILPRMLSIARPRVGGKDVISLNGSLKPSSRRSSILPRMFSIVRLVISGKGAIIFAGSCEAEFAQVGYLIGTHGALVTCRERLG